MWGKISLSSNAILSMQAWQKICEASRKEFELIYQRLGVTIQERGESFYNPFLAPLVQELMASGVAVESEGAKVSLPLPLRCSHTCSSKKYQDCPLILHRSTYLSCCLEVSMHFSMLVTNESCLDKQKAQVHSRKLTELGV